MRGKTEYIEDVLSKLDMSIIMLTGESAMNWSGWDYTGFDIPEVLVTIPELDKVYVPYVIMYHYVPNIILPNYETWSIPELPRLRIPNKERCIVDAIKSNFSRQDEGLFYEMFYYYLINEGVPGWSDIPKLKEVAYTFEVPWKTMEYHIDIALNDTIVS